MVFFPLFLHNRIVSRALELTPGFLFRLQEKPKLFFMSNGKATTMRDVLQNLIGKTIAMRLAGSIPNASTVEVIDVYENAFVARDCENDKKILIPYSSIAYIHFE